MFDRTSRGRIFICVLLGLFIVFAVALTNQCKERPLDVNTLMVEKLPPADALIDWQTVSCGSMFEGDCDDDDLTSTNALMVTLDDDGNCYAKEYEVWIADNFKMRGNIYKFRVNNLSAVLPGLLADGKNHGIWVFAICHEDDD